MSAYYNDNDAFVCDWLRNLISEGLIADGDVDDRSILDVEPQDLEGYTQAHFFAGIGGWSYALRLAGWPDDRPVWTGSCPCQPFSAAGKRLGTDDARHLWPEWFRLIRECRPPVVFGEQVAVKVGRAWLAVVRADLEGMGYRVGCADLCAACVGALHIRQRLWFVADTDLRHRPEGQIQAGRSRIGLSSPTRRMADTESERRARNVERNGLQPAQCNPWADCEWLPCRDGKARPTKSGLFPLVDGVPYSRVAVLRAAGNAIVPQVAAEFIKAYLECL